VSPGSKVHDTVTKRHIYAEAGVPTYWIVDPAQGHFTALRLTDGDYVAYVDTSAPVTVDWPVAISFDVGGLARR
jgi:Uma2 family endonuclease